MRPLRPVVIGLCLIASFIAGALATDAPTATLSIEHLVHFQSADGADLALASGRYSVEAAMPEGMRLSAASGKPVIVPATVETHEQKLAQPQALMLAVGTDEQHLILLLPGGVRLEAIGSLSGIRSRGLAAGPSTVSNVALQAAVMQLQPVPVMAPAPAPMPVIQAPLTVQAPLAVAPPVVMNTRPPIIPSAGPPPTGVMVTGTPLVASLRWDVRGDVKDVQVWRGDGPSVSVDVTTHGQFVQNYGDPNYADASGNARYYLFVDVVPDPRLTYRYTIRQYYTNGTTGEAVVQFASPPLINPPGFTARDAGKDGVAFQWQGVPGTVQYRLDGPGLPPTGLFTAGTSLAHLVPGGPGTWSLVAIYPGNFVGNGPAAVASTVARPLPLHSQPWLTKPNGPGQLSQVQTPAHQEINDSVGGSATGNPSGDLYQVLADGETGWLSQPYYTDNNGIFYREGLHGHICSSVENVYSGCNRLGLKVWLDTNSPLWDEAEQAANEAIYGNPGDLGVGRRAYCEQKMRGPPVPGLYTVCYATAHGITPGNAGFNNPQTITHPGEGVGSDFILSMVITKDASGTVFLALKRPNDYPTFSTFRYKLLPAVGLDTEGEKLLPFVCTSCHGGKYNPNTRKVDGASFLPLDPELLAFASPADQVAQEEKIRRINLMIHNSNPNSAIGAYIRGLYNGALGQPGARARPDYVPTGWAPQAGLYRQVVRPYCTMCHLAMPGGSGSYNFASWGNFQGNAPLIHASVCGAHTMPHNELQYKEFWTKDTGALYLPGLLAWTLGFPSCP
ncbi:MAG: hypothetical protein WCD08_06310 [Steroidobacteraceae bacterium]